MELMDKYKIQASIDDVISILDSAPIKLDLNEETNIVQLANRIPIAHLAIERGLKALILQCKLYDKGHSLNKLYRDLQECSSESADFLGKAFCDAVKFYGYNVKFKGFGHFRSLQDYLSKVGGEKTFELLRYWAIGETPSEENPIGLISQPVHRELLCALSCLFLRNSRQTVSDRVEATVTHAMFQGRHIHWNTDVTKKRDSVYWYKNWLFKKHPTRRSALIEAKQCEFAVRKDDEFVTETLRDAYDDLRQSKDPAVQYFINRCSYLPKGSQPRHLDAIPVVKWNDMKTQGTVKTPSGTCLGLINRYADAAWGIRPAEPGLGGVTDIAEAQADAKRYLVNRLSNRVTVLINGNRKKLRIVGEPHLPADSEWTADVEDPKYFLSRTETIEMEFWDKEHGLQPEDDVVVAIPSRETPSIATCYEGSVTQVADQMVKMEGTEVVRQVGEVT